MFQELIGSAVKISATVTVDGGGAADSATISIWHVKSNTKVANEQTMVANGDGVWEYVYQSSTSDKKGVYKCIITAVKSPYSDKSKEEFELEDN